MSSQSSNRSNQFHGVFTAIVTPFFKDGTVDWNGFDHLLKLQIKGGVQGIVPCGTTGESPTLTQDEKIKVIEHTIAICKGKALVMAGTGTNNTRETVEFSKKACELGADALLVVVPYYNKPSQAGLEAHFRAVADAVNKPIFLYNVPGRSGVSLAASTVAKLAEHPMIIGIKEASGNLATLTEMRRAIKANNGKDFIFLTGDDPTLLPFLTSGGHGVISVASNLMPAAVVRLCQDVAAGRIPQAMTLFEEIFEIMNALFIESNPVPTKSILAWSGLIEDTLRLPLVGLQSDNAAKLKKIWEQVPISLREELNVP